MKCKIIFFTLKFSTLTISDKIRCYLSKINGLNPRSNRLDLEIKLRKGEITPDEYRKIVLGE